MTAPAAYISGLAGQRVLVIGDAILDVYDKGVTEKLCREAPAPVVNLTERVYSCGGAANTAVNIAALGGKVSFLSVIGNDESASRLTKVLSAHGVNAAFTLRDGRRRTLTKTRICASSNILARVDEGDTAAIDRATAERLLDNVRTALRTCDVVVLSDYDYGVFSDYLVDALAPSFASRAVPVVVDARRAGRFRALAPRAVKPNYEEARRLLGIDAVARGERVEQMLKHGNELLERTGAGFVAATLDMDGTILFERGKRPYVVSCLPQPEKRTIGAGDSFISALALAVAADVPPAAAVRLAAAAAAVVIGNDGTGVCSHEDLAAHFRGHRKRVSDVTALQKRVALLRKNNKRIVFTNGCFDILHRGHVDFLQQARALGDVLIVALNNDAGIRRLKGRGRPVNRLEDRMEVLAGLQAVDLLISFDGNDAEDLLRTVRPDVFAKGGTYSVDSLPEARLVAELGGEVEIVPFRSQLSTSWLIERIQHPGGPRTRGEQRAL